MKLSLRRSRRSTRRSPTTSLRTLRPGFDGIGLWEFKLPDDDAANRALLRRARAGGVELRTAGAVDPATRDPGHGGPGRPDERIEAICASIRGWPRTARFVLCLTGPVGGPAPRARHGRSSSKDSAVAEAAGRARGPARPRADPPARSARRHPSSHSIAGCARAARRGRPRRRRDHGSTRTTSAHGSPTASSARVATGITGLHVADWPASRSRSAAALPGEEPADRRELVERAQRTRAGTARSTSRSSRRRTASGGSRPTRRPAARTPPRAPTLRAVGSVLSRSTRLALCGLR